MWNFKDGRANSSRLSKRVSFIRFTQRLTYIQVHIHIHLIHRYMDFHNMNCKIHLKANRSKSDRRSKLSYAHIYLYTYLCMCVFIFLHVYSPLLLLLWLWYFLALFVALGVRNLNVVISTNFQFHGNKMQRFIVDYWRLAFICCRLLVGCALCATRKQDLSWKNKWIEHWTWEMMIVAI